MLEAAEEPALPELSFTLAGFSAIASDDAKF